MDTNLETNEDNQNPLSPKLTIKLAETEDDLAFLLPLSKEFHAESHYSSIPYDRKQRDQLARRAIDRPDRHAQVIASYNGKPVGDLFCSIGEYMVGGHDLITTVQTFYVSRNYRHSLIGGRIAVRMLKGAIRWSEMRNAREMMIHVTTGIDIQRTDRFLRKAGFGVLGGNYALPLDHIEDDKRR